MKPLPAKQSSRRIVLLGVGHTNAHIVQQWATEPMADCELVCVSNFPSATYSGMLPGTLGGQYDDREMRIDLKSLADRAGARLVIANTTRLDRDTSQLHFDDHEPLAFDALSIGVGSIPAGWRQHAESPLLVPIKPMQNFLSRLHGRLNSLESPLERTIRVAIVGGGVAGVEIACCLQQYARQQGSRILEISIYTSGNHVAPGMTSRSARRIEQLLAERQIHLRFDHRITEVNDSEIVTSDGKRYPVDCVVWATGAEAPPLLGQLGLETDDRGFIATSSTLQSLTDPRVFAVGDSGTLLSSPVPKAGVYAVRQSPVLWHNLRALLEGRTLKHFQPQDDFLKILNTGDGKGLLQYRRVTAHARWCWYLKNWIDKRFVDSFH